MEPNLSQVFPDSEIQQRCFIKNEIRNLNIIVGDYMYYNDVHGAKDFEKHVTHHYDFIGDKL